MRTFDKKDVYSWANCESATQYIGQKGYFGDTLKDIQERVKENCSYVLKTVNPTTAVSFIFSFGSDEIEYSHDGLFLPADKVKEVEEPKKWRAFRTFEEFVLAVGLIGCHIRYRFKDDISNEFLALIVGFNYEAQTVTINNSIYSFKELFKKFEFYKNQKWQPFGVEE